MGAQEVVVHLRNWQNNSDTARASLRATRLCPRPARWVFLVDVRPECVIEVLGGSAPPMILSMPSEIEVAAEAWLRVRECAARRS